MIRFRSFTPAFSVVILTAICLLPSAIAAEEKTEVLISQTTIPPLPADVSNRSGISGGISGGSLIVIGGVDADGKCVPEALSCPIQESSSGSQSAWKRDPLPEAPAWGATTQHAEEVIVAGGLVNGVPTSKVTAYRMDGGKITMRDLPPLPEPVVGAGAAMLGDKLYIAGGLVRLSSSTASRRVLVLDLAASPSQWSPLPDMPGTGKVLPMLIGQYDLLEVIGGRFPDAGGSYNASKEVLVYHFKPAEGTTFTGWMRGTDLPIPLAGGQAAQSGQAHTLVFGADSTPKTGNPLSLSTTNQSPAFLYHVVTDAWVKATDSIKSLHPAMAKSEEGKLTLFGGKGDAEVLQESIPRTTKNLNWTDYLMILLYFFFIGYIGYYFRNQKSAAEYSLGNRQTPWWAAGISMFATAASAISFMAVPALVFSSNLFWLFPTIVFIPVYFFQSRITYPILRRLEITSTFEYLERRFNVALRLIASFFQILFQTFGRSSIVLVLPSIAISATTGLDVRWSVIIMGVLTTIYTSVGGFEAVTWTLVFQGGLKALAPIAIIWICISGLPGGFHEFLSTNLSHHKFDFAILGWDVAFPLVWVMLIRVFLEQTIWQAGDQAVIQRVFASKDNEIRKVTAMNFSCGAFIAILASMMGLAIFAYFHAHPEKFDASSSIDQIVPLFVIQAMPHGAVGIVIAAIFASAMATVAGAMNSVGTIFTVDFYERWFPNVGDKANLRMMRLSTIGTGVAATLIALWLTTLNLKSIMVTWNIVSSMLGGGIVGIFALGMFSTRANSGGAICGAILSILLGLYVKFFTGIHWAFLLPILIFSAMIIGYACSFLFKKEEIDLKGLTVFHLK